MAAEPPLIAIFGPTAVGKTAVAVELAGLLRARGQDPVAISADSIQVYRGLEELSGAPSAEERSGLEHRLVGVAAVTEEFSAGRFARLAHEEIDAAIGSGRRPIVVGGTGLYMRAALAELELRPPVDPELRAHVEADLRERGSSALHAELPERLRAATHPNDRKRIARSSELLAAGIEPHAISKGLWTERLRRPAVMVGITLERDELDRVIERRARAIAASGAAAEV
nr:tRNA (adenosine(37)-N6)-dimethylallyltransferase MiaA [Solirubrobacterales bacterium]